MKRLIALFLCLVLSLSLFSACGSTESTASTKDTSAETEGTQAAGLIPEITAFSVGYAKADITPTDPVPLRGYGDAMERISEGFLEPLYATCVAFAESKTVSSVASGQVLPPSLLIRSLMAGAPLRSM